MTFRKKVYLAAWFTIGAALCYTRWNCVNNHSHNEDYISDADVLLAIWLIPTVFIVLIFLVNVALAIHYALGEIED